MSRRAQAAPAPTHAPPPHAHNLTHTQRHRAGRGTPPGCACVARLMRGRVRQRHCDTDTFPENVRRHVRALIQSSTATGARRILSCSPRPPPAKQPPITTRIRASPSATPDIRSPDTRPRASHVRCQAVVVVLRVRVTTRLALPVIALPVIVHRIRPALAFPGRTRWG